MNEYMQKRIDRQAENNETLANILAGILPALETRGLVAKLSACKNGEYQEQEIVITDSTQENFEATICLNDFSPKATLYFKGEKTVVRRQPESSYQTEPRYNHDRYDYLLYVDSEKLKEAGLEYIDYRWSLYQLRKEFKATKSIKLILNDILPKLDIYKKVIEITAPQVKKNIQDDEDYILLKCALMKASGYSYISNDTGSLSATVEGLGEISISPHSAIKFTKELTKEELLELIKTV